MVFFRGGGCVFQKKMLKDWKNSENFGFLIKNNWFLIKINVYLWICPISRFLQWFKLLGIFAWNGIFSLHAKIVWGGFDGGGVVFSHPTQKNIHPILVVKFCLGFYNDLTMTFYPRLILKCGCFFKKISLFFQKNTKRLKKY